MFGTFLDGCLGQFHVHRGFRVTNALDLAHGYLHFLAGEAVTGLDDELIDGPALVVDQKITDMPDNTVGGLKMVAGDSLGAAQMGIGADGPAGSCGGRRRGRGGCWR